MSQKNTQKKRQVEVLIGDSNHDFVNLLTACIKKVIKGKYYLNIRSTCYGEELLKLAENSAVDILILFLNNIVIYPVYPVLDRMENILKLFPQIKTTYRGPIIAFLPNSLIDDYSSIADRAKIIADFFFPVPFEPYAFMEAIEKCLEMRTEFDEVQQKKSDMPDAVTLL